MATSRYALFVLLCVLTTAFSFSPLLLNTNPSRSQTSIMSLSMSATISIEREGTVLVPERQSTPDPTRDPSSFGSENWEVRIYNDGLNTREHVARSLVQVTGLSELLAYQTMMMAHQNGIASVGQWVYEIAELYHDRLRTKGIICDIIPVDEDC